MTIRTWPTAPRHGWELGPRYALWDGPMTRLTTMAAMPASTALAIGDVWMPVIGLDPDACSSGWAPPPPPARNGLAGRRVTLHRTASEPLDRSSPGRGPLVRIDQRNRCTLSGVAHRRVTRQAFPCAALLLRDERMFVVYKGLSPAVDLNQYGTKLRMRCPEWGRASMS